MARINFYNADVSYKLSEKRKISKFIKTIFSTEEKSLNQLAIILCSDEYLLSINEQFLKLDYYTDIITFDLSANKDGIVGEIYISIERVKENAENVSALFKNEILRVIFHGCLHLCGYKDKKKSEITIMRQKEDYYLRLFAEK
jgi:rRNA maturation RNase YbeY